MRATFTLFEGPSLVAPHPAVVVEAPLPPGAPSRGQLEDGLRRVLPPGLLRHVPLPLADVTFETLVASLANAFQDCVGVNGLEARAERSGGGHCRIVLGFVDPLAATVALQAALEVAAGLFAEAAGRRADGASLAVRLQRTLEQMRARQPDPLARALMRAARRRGIPVQPVAPGSRVWLYGQGSRGVQMFEAASHLDGMTGTRLARDKFQSNQLVTRLGFPGVRHGVASGVDAARRAAREIGYPLVVKPVRGAKGAGITVHVTDDAGLVAAFGEAQRAAAGDVLVERYVAGDDHRLVVIGGRFAWAVRRTPPRVTGDGERSVAELIDAENRRRAALPAADIAAVPLALDADMRAVMASQGLEPGSRPAAGAVVTLRRIANVARGGTLADCTAEVHPEVRDMAEAIARAFHLDAAGLDFITPDIGRSWREVACAVLEVNATPGFSSDARAELILDARFPGGSDGCLPAVVLLDAAAAALDQVEAVLESAGRRVGRTDGQATTLAGWPRAHRDALLPARVAALVLDPACDALVIGATSGEIGRHGFPLARCDLALLADPAKLSAPLRALVGACARRVLPLPDADGPLREAVGAVLPTAPPP